MAAPLAYPRNWTVNDYLMMERHSPCRHEFLGGHVYALPGGTPIHGAVAAHVSALLDTAVRGGPCRVHTADMKVRVTPTIFLYADVSVACGRAAHNAAWLDEARLVMEVLSESTATYDRGDKFTLYQQHVALQDYVLVETRWQAVEVRSRTPSGAWTSRVYAAGEAMVLPSLGVTLPVAGVYEDVDVPTTSPAG